MHALLDGDDGRNDDADANYNNSGNEDASTISAKSKDKNQRIKILIV